MVCPIRTKKIVKKRTQKFLRHKCEEYKRLGKTWRRPRGIDNPIRRRYRSHKTMVKIGFGSDKRTKHLLPSGFKKLLIKSPAELELLMMNNRKYCGELAHNLSRRKKIAIVKRAAELNVYLTNGKGKLKAEEKKVENA